MGARDNDMLKSCACSALAGECMLPVLPESPLRPIARSPSAVGTEPLGLQQLFASARTGLSPRSLRRESNPAGVSRESCPWAPSVVVAAALPPGSESVLVVRLLVS